MGLDYDLTLVPGDLAEQASHGGLGAGVEVYLGLLQQKHWRSVYSQQFSDDWQHLADSVSYVDQVALRTFLLRFTESSNLYLKGSAFLLTQGFN